MRTVSILLPLLHLSASLASPTEQIVFGLGGLSRDQQPSSGDAYHVVNEWLDDAKKAILKGKKNLDKWYHGGKEFIKQNGLLCRFRDSLMSRANML
jgi:cathepsin A (carboxypeptidase C)